MVTTVTVSVNKFNQSGVEMNAVVGTFGTGKRPTGRIVMGTFPTGSTTWFKVLTIWMKANPDIKVTF
jgi:hypothetical protein